MQRERGQPPKAETKPPQLAPQGFPLSMSTAERVQALDFPDCPKWGSDIGWRDSDASLGQGTLGQWKGWSLSVACPHTGRRIQNESAHTCQPVLRGPRGPVGLLAAAS